MATVNKDFKIKHGLVVEGSTGTINGVDILTKNTDSDNYILDLVGGVAYITSVNSVDFAVTDGELAIGPLSDIARAGDITTALTGYATETYVGQQGFLVSSDLTGYATETYVGQQGFLTSSDLTGYATETYVGQQGFLVSSDLTGYVTETGTQTLSNKTFSDAITLTGAGDFTINGNANIVLTPGTGNHVKWGSDTLATETYADQAVTDHNDLTTGVHGVTGDVVGTSDTQDISNKRIIDTLYFSDGVTLGEEAEIAVRSVSHDFDVQANLGDLHLKTVATGADVQITSDSGDILLNASGTAYYGSASAENEIATHGYVDNAVSGLAWKQAVNLLANVDVNMTGNTGTLVIDGHAALDTNDVGYRILLTNQSIDSENGIYEYTEAAGVYTLVRTADADVYSELIGAAVYVMEGTQYSSTSWVQGDHYITDFSGQDWTQFSGQGSVTAGDGITVDGLEVSINRTTVDDWYEPSGSVSTHSGLATGVHGVTGDVVGTSDTQTLTNKTLTSPKINEDVVLTSTATELNILDGATLTTTELNYVAGVTSAIQNQIDDKADAANPTITGGLTVQGSGDFTINADAGIILQPGTSAYLTSATAGNEIATQGYVDNAVDNVTIDLSTAAGEYLTWNPTVGEGQFDVNVSDLATVGGLATETYVSTNYVASEDLDTDVAALGYAKTVDVPTNTDDISEEIGATNLYFTDQRALDAVSGSNIQPLSIDINTYRTEQATQQVVASASTVTAHTFTGNRSVKYLVRTVGTVSGTVHSQVTELLVTVDGNNNVAVTEYGTIYTSLDPLATATMDYDAINEEYRLRVTTAISGAEVVVAATILTWD